MPSVIVYSQQKHSRRRNNLRFAGLLIFIFTMALLLSYFRASIFPPMSVMTWPQFLFILGAFIVSTIALITFILPKIFKDMN